MQTMLIDGMGPQARNSMWRFGFAKASQLGQDYPSALKELQELQKTEPIAIFTWKFEAICVELLRHERRDLIDSLQIDLMGTIWKDIYIDGPEDAAIAPYLANERNK